MAPPAKVNRELIIEVGLKLVREEGIDCLNVRKIATELKCSTRPILYYYKTMDELKKAVYDKADEYHSQYIMTMTEDTANPLLSIGLRYIRFAQEEKNLFRFLFQSNSFQNDSFRELLANGDNPIIQPLCEAVGLTIEQAKEVFEMLFICVHGVASLIANNSIFYDEKYYEKLLTNTFYGAVGIVRGGQPNDEVL